MTHMTSTFNFDFGKSDKIIPNCQDKNCIKIVTNVYVQLFKNKYQ